MDWRTGIGKHGKSKLRNQPVLTVENPPDYYTRLNQWLTERRRGVLLALLVIAATVRAVFFLQALPTPLVQMDKWDQTDMGYFDFWAKKILDGDYLCRNVSTAMHASQYMVADKWLELNPALKDELTRQAQAEKTEPQRLLWRQWREEKTFHQEPGYPYLIALTYLICGKNLLWVFGWQMLLGIGAVILAFRIVERHFDAVAGTAAGLLTALAAVGLMHELLLLRDGPIAFLTLLLIDLTDGVAAKPTWRRWLAMGAVLGFAIVFKSVFVPYLPVAGGLLLWQSRKEWRKITLYTAALTGGLLLALAPVIARNLMVGLTPLKMGSNAGYAFVLCNTPDFAWEAPNPVSDYCGPIMGESEGRFLKTAILTLQTHANVWSYLRIPLLKFDELWHWWERPDNVSLYHYQLFAPILKYLPTFFLIAPVGLVGLALSLRHASRHLSLYVMLAISILPLIVTTVIMRYRLPVVAITILFAGFALAWLLQQAAGRRWVRLGTGGAAMLLLGLWTGRPIPESISLIRLCDCTGSYMGIYREAVSTAVQNHDYGHATELLEDYLRYEPPVVRDPKVNKPLNPQDAMIINFYGIIQNDCANLYAAGGKTEQAQAHRQRVEELKKALDDFQNQYKAR